MEVTTGFVLEKTGCAQEAEPSLSTCERYRELIELELGCGRNAMGIWQDLVDRHGFLGYQSMKRYLPELRGSASAQHLESYIHTDDSGAPQSHRVAMAPAEAVESTSFSWTWLRVRYQSLNYVERFVQVAQTLSKHGVYTLKGTIATVQWARIDR